MLTGKNKIDFNDWLYYELIKVDWLDVEEFYKMPFMMQWGVYVDYFDKNGLSLEVQKKARYVPTHQVYYESYFNGYAGAWSTLEEAMKAALKDADRHINNKEL